MEISRRGFMGAGATFLAASGMNGVAAEAAKPKIQGFDETNAGKLVDKPWEPFSDKKVRVGIAGEGVCSFGSQFGYQNHPNVEVVACAELDSNKCTALQQRVGAKKTYASCEEMIKHAGEDKLDLVYIATDARSHIRLATMALNHGIHAVSAVPAFWGESQLDDIPAFIEAVRKSGKLYQMNETTAFRPECYAMRKIYEAGGFGEIEFVEGEYFHPHDRNGKGVPSFGNWRLAAPAMWYPTHSHGFFTCVTRKRFTEVTCLGKPSWIPEYKDGKNQYNNPYATEVALYRLETGGSARMAECRDLAGYFNEIGRCYGTKGCYREGIGYRGWEDDLVKRIQTNKPQLPPGVTAGGHGGSHGYLTEDILRAILVPGHKHVCGPKEALDTTVAGVYAHKSAMKGGETLKIPEMIL